jgi:hypothetical protein
MSTGRMSAHCEECEQFATNAGNVVRRLWELQKDTNHGLHTKNFLLRDNVQWLQLLHQAWMAHQFEQHTT